jgi:enoyl-CoA hydratase/carnithine racemase
MGQIAELSNLDLDELDKMTTLEKVGQSVYVLTMHFNCFSPKAVHAMHRRLDELERIEGPIALVTKCDHKKFYSAGLHFMVFGMPYWEMTQFLYLFNKLISRMLQTGYPTIAVMDGHAYAGGYMFSVAHDFRLLREDFGNICISEVNIGAVVPRGMLQLLRDKLKPNVVRDLAIYGKTFSSHECAKVGLVDQVLSNEKLLPTALSMAKTFAPKSNFRKVMSQIKSVIYYEAIRASDIHFVAEGTREAIPSEDNENFN